MTEYQVLFFLNKIMRGYRAEREEWSNEGFLLSLKDWPGQEFLP